MHHPNLWLAQERTTDARQKAAEERRARVVRSHTPGRSLLQRIRATR